MNRDPQKRQTEHVDAWIDQNIKGFPADQQLLTFDAAIAAIQKRTLDTLSEITFNAILDRVLYQSQQQYPLLVRVKIGANVILWDELRSMLSEKRNQGVDFTEAFRFFLIELFTILENLTAGIMMKPLQKELSRVTAKSHGAEDGEDA